MEEDDEAEDAPVASSRPAPRGPSAPGVIESAADARAAIDRVIDYFKRYEPSSPVPIILSAPSARWRGFDDHRRTWPPRAWRWSARWAGCPTKTTTEP